MAHHTNSAAECIVVLDSDEIFAPLILKPEEDKYYMKDDVEKRKDVLQFMITNYEYLFGQKVGHDYLCRCVSRTELVSVAVLSYANMHICLFLHLTWVQQQEMPLTQSQLLTSSPAAAFNFTYTLLPTGALARVATVSHSFFFSCHYHPCSHSRSFSYYPYGFRSTSGPCVSAA
jgi:hypothetical protein